MTRVRRLLVLAVVLPAVFGLGWVLAPSPGPAVGLVGARVDRWPVVVVPRGSDQLGVAALVGAAPYWGPGSDRPAAAAAPAATSTWWVAGVYGPESERTALVLFGDARLPPMRLGVGGKLPSGHIIVSIGNAGVCIRIGEASYMLGVERRER